MSTYLDQADALVQLDKLSQGVAATEKQLAAKGITPPPRPRQSDDVLLDIQNFTMHATVVQSLARGFLDKPPATATATAPGAAADAKPMNSTQLCKAVRNGTITIEQALAARKKPEAAKLTRIPKRS